MREEQYAAARLRVGRDAVEHLGKAAAQDKLRRAEHIAAAPRKGRAAPFSGRRERDDLLRLPAGRFSAALAQRGERRACSRGDRREGGAGGAQLLFRDLGQRDEAVGLHTALGERARLVEAQHVDARERLNRVQILHERLVTREPQHADGQHDARQEHQPLRHHPDTRAHRRDKPVPEILSGKEHLLDEHQHADRHERDADEADDPVDARENLGDGALRTLHALHDGRRVVLLADVLDARAHRPADEEAAREQQVALALFHRLALAGDQRLVHLAGAAQNHAVGAGLVS